MEQTRTLFLALSTRQNLANVPPLLQHMKPCDKLVWLESERAAANGWTVGAESVLRDRGLTGQERLQIGASLDDIQQAVAAGLPGQQHSAQPMSLPTGDGSS